MLRLYLTNKTKYSFVNILAPILIQILQSTKMRVPMSKWKKPNWTKRTSKIFLCVLVSLRKQHQKDNLKFKLFARWDMNVPRSNYQCAGDFNSLIAHHHNILPHYTVSLTLSFHSVRNFIIPVPSVFALASLKKHAFYLSPIYNGNNILNKMNKLKYFIM